MTSNNIAALASGNREFDLHLHVLEHGCEGGASRYTIGVWEQTTLGAGLRAICHIRPLPDALLAIMGELTRVRDTRVLKSPRSMQLPRPIRVQYLAETSHARGRLGVLYLSRPKFSR